MPASGWQAGLGWLLVVAGLNTVASLFYYFRVAKALFFQGHTDREAAPQPLLVGFLGVLAVATVVFGLYTWPIHDWALRSLDMLAAL